MGWFIREFVLTYEGCVMLDAVMDVKIREVKAPRAVGAVEDHGDMAWDVETERGRKVVGRANCHV